jgi:nitrate/TMAO reductase-like tetraheme cytochrome c subunit
MTDSGAGATSRLQRLWAFFKRPSSLSWSVLVAAGVIAGIVLWGGFNWALELTMTEAFCVSCHEMRDNVYPELQETVHWKNRSGVRAICSDCHVPKTWIYKMKAKIEASHEVLHKILGTIGTKEKFEAHRLELAQNVWASMKASDSRECRNCHAVQWILTSSRLPRKGWWRRSRPVRPASIATRASRTTFRPNRRRLKRRRKSNPCFPFQSKCSGCDFLAISEGGIGGSHLGEVADS